MLNVLSIGGNALDNSKNLNNLLETIRFLSKKGKLLIVHGNGPQVGELADHQSSNLGILTAQTEAEIGVFLQEEISKLLPKAKSETVLTRVLVDKKDPAFKNPSKPIGKFYTKSRAAKLESRFKIKRLIHGYRRVVASPKPRRVMNIGTIKTLLRQGYIVIAGGGGGIPITYKGKWYDFVDAVIDKDYTSALMARELGAKRLYILTGEDGAYINYQKKAARMIGMASVRQMSLYLKQGEFEEGSMKPKVEACIDFIKASKGTAAIGNLNKAKQVISLNGCTVITP